MRNHLIGTGAALIASGAVWLQPTEASQAATAPVETAGISSTAVKRIPRDDATRRCIMRKESGGNYRIVSPGGTYHGAYQFSRSTGDTAARRMGRPDLVGTPASRWAPATQDRAFWALWAGGAGRGHWPTARGC